MLDLVCRDMNCPARQDERALYCDQGKHSAIMDQRFFTSELGDFRVLAKLPGDAVSTPFDVLRIDSGQRYILREYLPRAFDGYAEQEFKRLAESLKQFSSQSDQIVPVHGYFVKDYRFYTLEQYVHATGHQ